jgi:serine/threonine-protein kinase RsbW
VEIRLPAEVQQLFVIRSMVGTIFLRQDFDLDAVADLKLVADEMCATLIARAVPGATLICRLRVDPVAISLTATVPTTSDRPVERDTFGWQVLTALTDSVFAWTTPDATDGSQLHIRVSKTRKTEYLG